MPEMKALSKWGAAGFFRLDLVYLAILVGLLIARPAHLLWVDRIEDPLGGVIPIAVPWFGALGAVVISLYGVFDHNDEWKVHWNYWHAARPFMGAIFAVIANLIFVGLINATGSQAQAPAVGSSAHDLPYLVIGFLVGFREETFRQLIQRAVDLVLGPGIPGQTPGKVSVTVDATTLGPLVVNTPTDVQVTVSNSGTAMEHTNTQDVQPKGVAFVPLKGSVTIADVDVAGVAIGPLVSRTGKVTVTPTAAGDFEVNLIVSGSFGSRTVTLSGSAK